MKARWLLLSNREDTNANRRIAMVSSRALNRKKIWLFAARTVLATGLVVMAQVVAAASGPASSSSIVERSAAAEEPDKEGSLYQRLGGYEAISAVVEDFAPKLFGDSRIAHYFRGMGDDTKQQFMQKNKNLVCNVTGGPCKVISRPAKTVHGGLGITEREFNIVVEHLVQTLDKFKVPSAEKTELLAIIGTLKPDIVDEN